jgi:hypothetical protein
MEDDSTRRKVTSLQTSDDNLDSDNMESGRLYFGIDTRLAIVKKIKIRESSPVEAADIARFEMAQSLLEAPEQFYFDAVPVESKNGCNRFVSIAYHREKIDSLSQMYQDKLCKPSGFKLDAMALAAGYSAFCRVDPGDLQVLANIEAETVTMAILHRGKLYSAGHLESAPGKQLSSDGVERLASEFKMTLSFHLAEIFQDGITVPLSKVILSGSHAHNENLMSAIKNRFSTEVILPHFHEGYFQPASETIDRHRPEQFLIPMGLALG